MKCFKCEDGKIRSIGYVSMEVAFFYGKDREPQKYSFIGYSIIGFEKASSPFCNGHFLYRSEDFDECARKLAQYRYELENFPDDDADEPAELPFP